MSPTPYRQPSDGDIRRISTRHLHLVARFEGATGRWVTHGTVSADPVLDRTCAYAEATLLLRLDHPTRPPPSRRASP